MTPAPTTAPRNAPRMPRPRLNSPDDLGRVLIPGTGVGGRGAITREAAGGAAGGVGLFSWRGPAGAAAARIGAEADWARMALAAPVLSAPQTGQFATTGIWPLTGSTSNLNF